MNREYTQKINLIPNIISIFRIILSMLFISIRPFSLEFYIIYIICGLSDMLDGFLARRLKAASRLGEKLDSVADFIMVCILIFVLYPVLKPAIDIIVWIIVIALVRLTAAFVAVKKYKAFVMLHTIGNKVTGIVLFISPYLFLWFSNNTIMYLVCCIASISAFEELVIQFTSKELHVNRKSLFFK